MMQRNRRDDLINQHLKDGKPSDWGAAALKEREQCILDWNRDAADIHIDGKSFLQICIEKGKEYYHMGVDKEGKPTEVTNVTADQLGEIWKEYILKDIPEPEKSAMLDNMSKFMHQGGYLNIMQASLEQELTTDYNAGVCPYMFGAGDLHRSFDISTGDGKIAIKSSLVVDHLKATQGVEYGGKVELTEDELQSLEVLPDNKSVVHQINGEQQPLMSAEGNFTLSCEGGIPKFSVESFTLEHHTDFTRELFEKNVLKPITERLYDPNFVNKCLKAQVPSTDFLSTACMKFIEEGRKAGITDPVLSEELYKFINEKTQEIMQSVRDDEPYSSDELYIELQNHYLDKTLHDALKPVGPSGKQADPTGKMIACFCMGINLSEEAPTEEKRGNLLRV